MGHDTRGASRWRSGTPARPSDRTVVRAGGPPGWLIGTVGILGLLSAIASGVQAQPNAAEMLEACKAALDEPNVEAAVEACQKAIVADPALIEAYLVLGRLWVNIMEYRLAVDLLQQAKHRAPGNHEVRVWLVSGLFYWERCNEAVAEGEESLIGTRFPPEERATVLYFVGKCLHDLGRHQLATHTLEQAAAIELTARPALFEREDLSRFIDQALVLSYWGHLALTTGDHEARLRLVKVLLRREDILGSLRGLETIVSARPGWAEPYYWLGLVHLNLARASRNSELMRSHYAAARRALETYVRLDAGGPHAEEAGYLLLGIPRP